MLFHGYRPVCGESRTKLYRREVASPETVALVSAPVSPGRLGSLTDTRSILQRVGDDVGHAFGLPLHRSRNGFSDQSRRIQVQVLVGRRARCCSKFTFRFNPGTRTALAAAENGWLVLAPAEFGTYVLIPWSHASVMIGDAVGAPLGVVREGHPFPEASVIEFPATGARSLDEGEEAQVQRAAADPGHDVHGEIGVLDLVGLAVVALANEEQASSARTPR